MVARRLLEEGKRARVLAREGSPSVALAQQGLATDARELVDAGARPREEERSRVGGVVRTPRVWPLVGALALLAVFPR